LWRVSRTGALGSMSTFISFKRKDFAAPLGP